MQRLSAQVSNCVLLGLLIVLGLSCLSAGAQSTTCVAGMWVTPNLNGTGTVGDWPVNASSTHFDLHYDPAPGHGLWSRTHFYFDLQNLANRTFVGSASNITDTLANVGGAGVENPGYGSSTALAQTATGSIYADAPRLSIGGFRIKF